MAFALGGTRILQKGVYFVLLLLVLADTALRLGPLSVAITLFAVCVQRPVSGTATHTTAALSLTQPCAPISMQDLSTDVLPGLALEKLVCADQIKSQESRPYSSEVLL